MSTSEYNDLFLKCQSTGMYHVFCFDIVGCKKMWAEGNFYTIDLFRLITLVYNKLHLKEINENKKILVFNDGYVFLCEKRKNGFGFKEEPFIFGDLVGFTVYKDSITREEVIDIFNECKEIIGIDYEFHYADGYYETDNWLEGQDKYFRGYCIDLLSNLHKPYNERLRKELEKIKAKTLTK